VQASPIVWLSAEREGRGPRLVLVHGFAQTSRCWGPIGDDLARDHEVVRVDAPGHGGSAEILAGLRTGGRLIADQGGEAVYVGYSMGARFCLHLALSNPELVRALVLIGGTPGIDDPAERSARAAADRALAERIRTDGVDAFVDGWLGDPLFARLPEDMRFVEERRKNTAEGLASSLEQAGTGAQDSRWPDLHRLAMPVLAVVGGDDAKFRAIGQQMVAAIGDNAELALIEGAGHAAHLEQPDRFLTALRAWLARAGAGG
jgi:2-succinyl-6-hydroxy-2,4-cyclohexadiene-1-carboxylate synthase